MRARISIRIGSGFPSEREATAALDALLADLQRLEEALRQIAAGHWNQREVIIAKWALAALREDKP